MATAMIVPFLRVSFFFAIILIHFSLYIIGVWILFGSVKRRYSAHSDKRMRWGAAGALKEM